MAAASRTHDLVLFGATGFTGGLVAEHLARHAPPQTRWAIAGRDRGRLEAVRARLAAIEPRCAELPLLTADATDPASMRALAEAARVVVTTVGPYALHGEALVAACAQAGTDYADLTGEPEFVDRTWLCHHETAVATGARLVHCCGFDSVPHDLGAQFTVEQLPEGAPLEVRGFVRAEGRFSAGTYHSVVTGFGRVRETVGAARARRARERPPEGRRVRTFAPRPYREPAIGAWAVPLPTIDPVVVARSARALERYGPDFRYAHHAWVRHLPVAAAAGAGIAGVFALAQLPPARRLLLRAMRSGDGPDERTRARSSFTVRFVGTGGGRRVVTEVTGGDPGYEETAAMLAQAGLCLAHDALPPTAGQVTTAVAMGPALRARLERQGIAFRVLESTAA
ncbi:MAG: saccharopine dehydrogenase NADP-binding domain-containing protein [Solirubrobacteraceae bacterium]|nr:saccharopine dehydrogenase NADP-binding domain-containing protein [Solirubrobacteraceae bacterium]